MSEQSGSKVTGVEMIWWECPEDGELVDDQDCANCAIPCDGEIKKRAEIEANERREYERGLRHE